jgi:uncharacterized protein YndB with AHSA1/START domain
MVIKTETQTFVYATYIRTTPEKLWEALTHGAFSEKYWMGYHIELEPRVGGRVRILPPSGGKEIWNESGKVLAWEPGRKLVYEFSLNDPPEFASRRDGPSRVTYELQPLDNMVRLRLIHENLLPEDTSNDPNTTRGINNGWPAILSSLKSLLETGQAIPLDACSH